MSTQTLSVTEAKQRFTELVKQVGKYYDRYLVTKNGTEAAVVMSSEEYGSLLETLDILGSREEVKAIVEGQEHVRRGKTIPLAAYRAVRSTPKRKR
jgi:prevent-host-death family protein